MVGFFIFQGLGWKLSQVTAFSSTDVGMVFGPSKWYSAVIKEGENGSNRGN